MENKNEKKAGAGTGTAFTENQASIDQAKNERLKSEAKSNKLPPEKANNPNARNTKSDVSRKKTGSGKQSSPGD
jgi:hypothetical protein